MSLEDIQDARRQLDAIFSPRRPNRRRYSLALRRQEAVAHDSENEQGPERVAHPGGEDD